MASSKTNAVQPRITNPRVVSMLKRYADLLSEKRGYRIHPSQAVVELASEVLPYVISRLEAEIEGRQPPAPLLLMQTAMPASAPAAVPEGHPGHGGYNGHHGHGGHNGHHGHHGHNGHGHSGQNGHGHTSHGPHGHTSHHDASSHEEAPAASEPPARKPSMADLMRSLDDFE